VAEGGNDDVGLTPPQIRADDKILGIAATPPERPTVTIDGTGKTALPGLIDTHVHMLTRITEADTRAFINDVLLEHGPNAPLDTNALARALKSPERSLVPTLATLAARRNCWSTGDCRPRRHRRPPRLPRRIQLSGTIHTA
jgi:hypothetical protein